MNQNNQLLSALGQSGVLLNISVRYWRARKKLNPQDLGLQPGSVSSRLISLGQKKLLPKDALAEFSLIESRAHAVVEESTFPFLGGIGRFLPNPRLDTAVASIEALKSGFWQAQARFIDRYADLRRNAVKEWREASARLDVDPDRMAHVIENSFPAPEKMGRYFGFSSHMYQIKAPESLSIELTTAGDQLAIADARRRAANTAAREIESSVQSFIGDAVATMRQETAKLCEQMLESMKGGSSGVHQKTLNRLTNFIERFKDLNFANDRELESQLEEARKSLLSRTAAEYRDSSYARRKLRAGLRKLAETAGDLARQDAMEIVDSFGAMGRRKICRAA